MDVGLFTFSHADSVVFPRAMGAGSSSHLMPYVKFNLAVTFQVSWKVTARLNFTYGIRWELDPAPIARGKTTLSAWENVNNPTSIDLAPSGTPLWATTYRNFAPRFGVAYSLTPQGDFVVRAGVGIFYDTGVGNSANLAIQFPNSASGSFQNVP